MNNKKVFAVFLYKINLTLGGVGGGLEEWKVWSLIVCYDFIFSQVEALKPLYILQNVHSWRMKDPLYIKWNLVPPKVPIWDLTRRSISRFERVKNSQISHTDRRTHRVTSWASCRSQKTRRVEWPAGLQSQDSRLRLNILGLGNHQILYVYCT